MRWQQGLAHGNKLSLTKLSIFIIDFMRGKLYIYTEEPEIFQMKYDNDFLYHDYRETAEAIARGDKIIRTLQMDFMSHAWIKAGWDIVIIDNGYEIEFKPEHVVGWPMDYYYMLNLWKVGELYQLG